MINKIIAESFKGVVLININICVYRFFKQFDPFFDTEICVMLADKGVLTFSDQILHFPVKRFERIAFTGRHPSNDGLFCTDVEGSDQFFGNIAGVKNKRIDLNAQSVSDIIYDRHDSIDVKDISGNDIVPDRKTCFFVQNKDQPCHNL